MFVKTITLRNILSFGPHEQQFLGLKKFNLLIGKNGTGKSNALRILGGLKVEIEPDVQVPIRIQTFGANHQSLAHPFKLEKSFFNDRNNNRIGQDTYLHLTYETGYAIHNKVCDNVITFKNGFLVRGKIQDIDKYTATIKPEWDNVSFINSLDRDVDDPTFDHHNPAQLMLNFGLRYIFDREYTVLHSGELLEAELQQQDGSLVNGGSGYGFTEWKWPSGVFRVAKVLQQLLCSGLKCLFLIEEPELHLEPRAIRRFIDLLWWLSCREVICDEAFCRVQKSWDAYHVKTSARYKKPVIQALDCKPYIQQIFIASHSPVLINEFLSMEEAAIFEIDSCWMDHNVGVNRLDFNGAERKEFMTARQLSPQTTVRNISGIAHSVLDALGASGADLLQCNGVVWVEGPSDVVYLEKWLDMYASENEFPAWRRGRNFEFQIYGGSILDSLCLIKDGSSSSEIENNKLVEMFSFSRNAFIIIDSDAVKKACLLYTSPSPRDKRQSRMPSSA